LVEPLVYENQAPNWVNSIEALISLPSPQVGSTGSKGQEVWIASLSSRPKRATNDRKVHNTVNKSFHMGNILKFSILFLLGMGSCLAASTGLWTIPIILVTPRTLDFKSVPSGTTVTNTFVVENVGRGKLVGTATVNPPFKIISGGDYSLRYGAAQIVTIIYTPSGATNDEREVKFTGGPGTKLTVVGKMAPLRPNQRLLNPR
jgi:hypothetical protein